MEGRMAPCTSRSQIPVYLCCALSLHCTYDIFGTSQRYFTSLILYQNQLVGNYILYLYHIQYQSYLLISLSLSLPSSSPHPPPLSLCLCLPHFQTIYLSIASFFFFSLCLSSPSSYSLIPSTLTQTPSIYLSIYLIYLFIYLYLSYLSIYLSNLCICLFI